MSQNSTFAKNRPGRAGSLNKQNVKATPGVLAAKVRDFGSNLLKCSREQICTRPAKVGHLASGAIYCAKVRATDGGDSQKGLHCTKKSSLHGRTRFAKVGPPLGRGQIC